MRILLSFFCVSCCFACPLAAQDFGDRIESTYDEDYRLYDRNEHGLDWNRYNYPESRRHRGYGY